MLVLNFQIKSFQICLPRLSVQFLRQDKFPCCCPYPLFLALPCDQVRWTPLFGQETEDFMLRNPAMVWNGNQLLVGALRGISASRVTKIH